MDYLFISGQIRAQESKLLNVNRLDRMIGADSPEAAFRVLSELQYSEVLDEGASSQSFDKVITKGLVETKDMIERSVSEKSGLFFIWLRFDINNIKRALKEKFLERQKELTEYTQDKGYSLLGTISKKELEQLVFKNKNLEGVDKRLIKIIKSADSILEQHDNEFRFVEYALDQAYFQILNSFKKSGFLKKLFFYLVESSNFRNFSRTFFVSKDDLPKEAWISFGDFSYSDIKKIKTFSDFIEFTKRTRFREVGEDLTEENDTTNLIIIEKYLDKCYRQFLEESTLGEISSVAIPFAYFEKRLQNSRLLKFIMFAKFNGMSSKEIYKTLEKF